MPPATPAAALCSCSTPADGVRLLPEPFSDLRRLETFEVEKMPDFVTGRQRRDELLQRQADHDVRRSVGRRAVEVE